MLDLANITFTIIYSITAEYDLSDHPVYDWTYNPDANISSERYSKPGVSNPYSLDILNLDFDPTFRYYTPPVSVWDYCDLEKFSKYPKCK
jgi:hypothetical protein|tara:strand:- start:220 stop:489 length:270 start_codon:yes stop_codon:yes gene_type:complete